MNMNEPWCEGWIHTPSAQGIDRAARAYKLLCPRGPYFPLPLRDIFPEPSEPRFLR